MRRREVALARYDFPLKHYVCALLMWCAGVAQAAIPSLLSELMQNHRRLVVLSETAAPHLLGEARRAGHYLFVRNQHLIRDITHEVQFGPVGAKLAVSTSSQRYRELTREADAAVKLEGDQLALRAPLQALVQADFLHGLDREDIRRRLNAIGDVRRRFGADVDEAARAATTAARKPARPLWDAYVKSLTADFSAERVISRLDEDIFTLPPDTGDFSEAAARARFLEWDGTELPARTVLLTFDDGPHATHTPRVLDILKAHSVHAIFFMVGRNLGTVQDGVAVPGSNLDIVKRMVAEGHAVGNHSFTHPVLPKLSNERLAREIADTQLLLNAMAPAAVTPSDRTARTRTLRFPFGARNDRVLAEIDGRRLRSVMWNVDSLDWADPVPESIVQRVLREVERDERGIILMHDIQARTVDALPRIIVGLKLRGYTFLRWDGTRIAPEAAPEADVKSGR